MRPFESRPAFEGAGRPPLTRETYIRECMFMRRSLAEAEDTRRRVLDAALGVFDECGYADATMERISQRAGVTRGAVYHHFEDKADLLFLLLRREGEEVMRPLMAGLGSGASPLERVSAFLRLYFSELDGNARFRAVVNLLLFPGAGAPKDARAQTRLGFESWFKAFRMVLDEAQQQDELRSGVSVDAASIAVVTLAVGLTTTALQAPELVSISQAAESLIDGLMYGIAA